MIRDSISINSEEVQSFDKMQIALAIRDSTYGDELSCSLLKKEVIKNCEGCSLKYICGRLDELADDYTERTYKDCK